MSTQPNNVYISTVYVCPRCESGITSLRETTSCPNCGLPLGKQPVSPYTAPYTYAEQHQKYKDEAVLTMALSKLPTEKANSIMNDALLIMESIAGKNSRSEDIRYVVEMGIRIGQIASAYEKFLEAGGKHYPSFFVHTAEQQQQQKKQEIQNESNRTQERVVEILTPATLPTD